jgi:cytochrome c oxidase subunit 3
MVAQADTADRPEPQDVPEKVASGSGGLSAGGLMMTLLLVSLGILFAASMIIFLIVRFQPATQGPPPPPVPLPDILWVSTFIILISSGIVQLGVWAARIGKQRVLSSSLLVTLLLALAFIVFQIVAWIPMTEAYTELMKERVGRFEQGPRPLFVGAFFLLTGLHAAHVLGGMIPLVVVTLKAFKGAYPPEKRAPVIYLAAYWHFLDIVWVVLFGVLLVATPANT